MPILNTVADRQAEWSATANSLKASIDSARMAVFLLGIAGAILAALASQMGGAAVDTTAALANNPRAWVAIAAALSLAIATFFTQRLLGTRNVTAWVRARAISEALKREGFKFATGAKPYNDAAPAINEDLLDKERQRIEDDGKDLLPDLVPGKSPGSTPRVMLTPAEYDTKRVDVQIAFYLKNAAEYKSSATLLRRVEFCLALFATILTAVASVAGKTKIGGVVFDIAAVTAVLTTIAGAVLAHVEAMRYDFLVMNYVAARRRLQERAGRPHTPLPDYVTDCEAILANESSSWIAKWTS